MKTGLSENYVKPVQKETKFMEPVSNNGNNLTEPRFVYALYRIIMV